MAIARVTEIIASSPKGFEDAIAVDVKRANQALKKRFRCLGERPIRHH